MDHETYKAVATFTTVAMWVALIPVLIGLFRSFRAGWGWQVIIIYFAVSLVTDNILTYFSETILGKYLPRIFTFLEFALISLYFISITKRKALRIIMFGMIIPFAGVTILDFFLGGIMKRDDLSLGVESLIFITYSVITLFFILKDAEYSKIMARGEFWMISSVLLYFGGNIFVFISTNYMSTVSAEHGILFWALHGVLCVIFYLLSTIGLWKAKELR